MKIGIDTCSLIYAFDVGSPYYHEAKQALEKLALEGNGYICPQNITEFLVALSRKGISLPEAMEAASFFEAMFPMVHPRRETLSVFKDILMSSQVRGKVIYDAFLAATYLSNGIDVIYTYNTRDFERLGAIKVWKP